MTRRLATIALCALAALLVATEPRRDTGRDIGGLP